MTALRIVFMGSPGFSVPVLSALVDAGHEIICVYTQPPRPAGRGQKERPCPVHAYALEQGFQVRTPKSLKNSIGALAEFEALDADLGVVVAYGLILPPAVLDAPEFGCINAHASLLPRWRGAAPIQRAILAGDTFSGVCIMQMDEGLDTGGVLLREETPITAETTASDLHDRLAAISARLCVDAVSGLADGNLNAVAQPEDGVTYASKLEKSEGLLDWSESAVSLERQVRALNPWPGVWFEYAGERIRVLTAECVDSDVDGAAPGTILDDNLLIACGEGALRPTRLQRPGKKPVAVDDFLRGYEAPAGTVFCSGGIT